MNMIDIIVPVHDAAAATRRCLDSVLAAPRGVPFELVVVDDGSTDAELRKDLAELASGGRVTLLVQPERLGYAAAVNRGLALHPDRDAVVLHSDAVVAGDWLDRLAGHAAADPSAGIVVPFTGRGGPAVYRPAAGAGESDREAVARFDRAFAHANPGQRVALALVWGPCLYLRRSCVASVGAFETGPLGADWGSEIDFCLRAGSVGFHHYLAGDVYVGHSGAASYGDRAAALAAGEMEALGRLYPDYPGQRARQGQQAPERVLARRVDLLRLAEWPTPRIAFIAHPWGGGVRRHMNDLAALIGDRCEVLLIEPAGDDSVRLSWPRSGEEFAAWFQLPADLPALGRLLGELGVVRLHYHHVHLLPRAILDLPAAARLPYDCTLHDYFPICPQYHLVTAEGRYCGEPAAAGCAACLAQRPHRWKLDIVAWRAMFHSFLAAAARVIAPSSDVARRIHRYFPEQAIEVWPHPESPRGPAPQVARVVVLGNLSPEKGLRVVAACAQDAKQAGLPLTFRVLGASTEPVPQAPELPLSIFGQYDDSALPTLLAAEKPDVIFFPAQVPETYSYTLSVAMATGVPIVTSSLGAFAERLADYPRAAIVRWNALPSEWNVALLAAASPVAAGHPEAG